MGYYHHLKMLHPLKLKKSIKNIILNFLTVFVVFFLDRLSKIYILKLAEFESSLDIYVLPNLNFYLIWNKGISFGLLPFSDRFSYVALSFLISILILINNIELYHTEMISQRR